MNKWLKFLIPFVLSIVTFFIVSIYLNQQQSLFVSCLVLLVALWTSDGLPMGIVSLLPVGLYPCLGILDLKLTTSYYSKPIIFLFLGGFMLAIAVEKTNLHRALILRMFKLFPMSPRGIIFALAFTSAIFSSLLSNTTTALLLMPMALFLTEIIELKKRFVLSIAYGASIGGIMTPVGTPPNLILLGFLEDNSMQAIPFIKWIMMCAPLAFLMLIAMCFILSFGANKYKLEKNKDQIKDFDKDQKKLIYVLIALMVLLFINSPIKPYYMGLGLNEKIILMSFGILMFCPGFDLLTWDDSKKIPYEIIALFGAGFAIAGGMMSTGLADKIVESLSSFHGLSPLHLTLLVATLVTFSTEITSNMALTTMMIPVIYSFCLKLGLDPYLYLMITTICASYAFMLPIATAPNAIAMSSKVLHIKDMMKFGFIMNLIGILLVTIISQLIWVNFL
ncbi:MAG: anion transporter [Candidatus Cloacimonadota bacterium]|nr:MAG: anion transporter [Candidatus Cloacimonadota bacterium]